MAGKALDQEQVREFVGSAHMDLEKVKQLLDDEPGLLHAAMNWGGDDWETALGAASHVGRRDIAEWLIAQGARMDLFAAAMLGELSIVQSALERYPSMLNTKGPHGISLLQHALMGGEASLEVVNYLKKMTHELNRQEGGTGMIVVENYIEVKAGLADLVLERFKSPKSVHTFPGFVRMDVLHSKLNDETEVVRVCTTWENEEAFHAWSSSDSFRHAHNRRAEAKQSESSDIAVTSTSAHGAHGAGKDSKNGEPSTGPITGNRVTIHQVVVTHLPSEAHVSSILT